MEHPASADPASADPIVVRVQPRSREERFLLEVRREDCDQCPKGKRTISVWATVKGKAEKVSWCTHCFDAFCERVELGEGQREWFAMVRDLVSEGKVTEPFPAVRPALEDLERRGLL